MSHDVSRRLSSGLEVIKTLVDINRVLVLIVATLGVFLLGVVLVRQPASHSIPLYIVQFLKANLDNLPDEEGAEVEHSRRAHEEGKKHSNRRRKNKLLIPHLNGAIIPGQFLYLVQGPDSPPPWLMEVGMRNDTQVIYGSFATELSQLPKKIYGVTRFIYIPNSTWTTGRNKLYAEALRFQEEQGWRAQYLVFTDGDAEVHLENAFKEGKRPGTYINSIGSDPYSRLHTALRNVQPAVGGIGFPRGPVGRNKCGPVVPCAPDIDAAWNAFHATAASMFLPYDAAWDALGWWNSQAIMIEILAAAVPEQVVQFNQFFLAQSTKHSRYPRSFKPFIRGENGSSPIATWLRPRVNQCLQDRIGMAQVGSSIACKRCALTELWESSSDSFPTDGITHNFMDMLPCKPFSRQ